MLVATNQPVRFKDGTPQISVRNYFKVIQLMNRRRLVVGQLIKLVGDLWSAKSPNS